MRRLTVLLVLLALLAPAGPALAQSDPFGPLPQSAPTPAPTPKPADDGLGEDVGRATLYSVAGALALVFVVIGVMIARDARRSLPGEGREVPGTQGLDPRERGRQRKRSKTQARSRARAQKAARRKNR